MFFHVEPQIDTMTILVLASWYPGCNLFGLAWSAGIDDLQCIIVVSNVFHEAPLIGVL